MASPCSLLMSAKGCGTPEEGEAIEYLGEEGLWHARGRRSNRVSGRRIDNDSILRLEMASPCSLLMRKGGFLFRLSKLLTPSFLLVLLCWTLGPCSLLMCIKGQSLFLVNAKRCWTLGPCSLLMRAKGSGTTEEGKAIEYLGEEDRQRFNIEA